MKEFKNTESAQHCAGWFMAAHSRRDKHSRAIVTGPVKTCVLLQLLRLGRVYFSHQENARTPNTVPSHASRTTQGEYGSYFPCLANPSPSLPLSLASWHVSIWVSPQLDGAGYGGWHGTLVWRFLHPIATLGILAYRLYLRWLHIAVGKSTLSPLHDTIEQSFAEKCWPPSIARVVDIFVITFVGFSGQTSS